MLTTTTEHADKIMESNFRILNRQFEIVTQFTTVYYQQLLLMSNFRSMSPVYYGYFLTKVKLNLATRQKIDNVIDYD